MTKLSPLALKQSSKIIDAIQLHPFNTELAKGILERSIFNYYIEQDCLYLQDFSKCLAMIASKAPQKFVQQFLSFAEGALIAEQEVVHGFLKNLLISKRQGK